MANWRDGLTEEQQREAEMQQGAKVIVEKYGALKDILAARFDPDYKPPPPRFEYEQEIGKTSDEH